MDAADDHRDHGHRLLIAPGPQDEAFVSDVADLAMRGLRPTHQMDRPATRDSTP
ncbi:hypothetical protein [Nonomuraea soli]|uniref:Uncharacterized protein n=1 Tax=Nonomuraea soli TaxID=1032476 RepID=A0A7W0CVN5_9ACTN|nr:hypothetical protein [Nonomuraea soli]MBA2897993.1 hypothetical protein [Nonomuraea soli]